MDDGASILRALRQSLWRVFECREETVYHYTDQLGLLGIISDGAIRAHSTRYQNDPSEGRTADEAFSSCLASYPDLRDLWNDLWEPGTMECFCASFSLERDLLSQWRGYAAGGAGFALGFHPGGFHPEKTTLYGKILYSKVEQADLIRRTLAEHLPLIESGGEKVPSNLEEITDPKEVVKLLPPAFLSLVSCVQVYESMMKNDAYREEREYRRVLLLPASDARDNDIHFEASTRGIRPYVEMPFWNGRQHFLKEIVVGPSFHSRTLGGLSRCS